MLRDGSGEPLLLLHGITGTERHWKRVLPLVAPHHDAIAITAPGHNGGVPWRSRPASVEQVVDDAERQLDELGIETAHVAGNSMGGWVAIELARRGRARSVCAFSPSGSFDPGDARHGRRRKRLEHMVRDARRYRALIPVVARITPIRKQSLALNALHGERMSPEDFVEASRDSAAVIGVEEILRGDEHMAPFDPLPCPVHVAWARADRVLEMDPLMENMRRLMPGATYEVLDDVGHVAMFDDPALVARTILRATGAVR